MYGSESWVWQKINESRVDVGKMRFLLNMCGVSLKDRCRNSTVRERCGLKDVATRVETGILQFWPSGKDNERRLRKQIYRASVYNGKIGKSRFRKSYAEEICGILKKGPFLKPPKEGLAGKDPSISAKQERYAKIVPCENLLSYA
ncbi:hypothetical protein EVAR_46633_1 [Eumeta japonica]|uniref:Uncharacterized protein n=1 Tax=Eumeta variegata TaxID=151549 RepID=A0A4C1WFT4_EUMVA|nr:hypothetical protein EVAR_46633_1 [Eumeta japonica]